MRLYKCLAKQKYTLNEFQIVPIRNEDRYDIMKWRNEQIYHLRQSKPLDKTAPKYSPSTTPTSTKVGAVEIKCSR